MAQPYLNNNSSNATHQLTKTLEFLTHVERYIDNAKSTGDREGEKVWNIIKVDREEYVDMLKCLTVNIIKNNKF